MGAQEFNQRKAKLEASIVQLKELANPTAVAAVEKQLQDLEALNDQFFFFCGRRIPREQGGLGCMAGSLSGRSVREDSIPRT
jgi:hypothetical protein